MFDPMDPYGINKILAQQNQLQALNAKKIVRVHGIEGVEALQMAPDSELLAMDDSAPMVWVIKTDSAGYKGVKQAFDITPHVEAPAPDVKGMEERLAAMEQKLSRIEDRLNE